MYLDLALESAVRVHLGTLSNLVSELSLPRQHHVWLLALESALLSCGGAEELLCSYQEAVKADRLLRWLEEGQGEDGVPPPEVEAELRKSGLEICRRAVANIERVSTYLGNYSSTAMAALQPCAHELCNSLEFNHKL